MVRFFHCKILAQKFPCEMSMCISTAQARTKQLSRFAAFRRCRFTSVRCSFFVLCPFLEADVGHPGRSKTSFCETCYVCYVTYVYVERGTEQSSSETCGGLQDPNMRSTEHVSAFMSGRLYSACCFRTVFKMFRTNYIFHSCLG